MKFKLHTTAEVADRIAELYKDPVLKPDSIKLVDISKFGKEGYNGPHATITFNLTDGELQDIFFLGYWTQLKKQQHEQKTSNKETR